MTKEKLEERIKLLEQQRDALKSNVLAYEGAIQDCQHWLTELDNTSEEVKEVND